MSTSLLLQTLFRRQLQEYMDDTVNWYCCVEDLRPRRKRPKYSDVTSRVSENDSSQLVYKIDCSNYRPEEIEVKLAKGLLEIGGKHVDDEDARGIFVDLFHKTVSIPKGTKMEDIKCVIDRDGNLTVTVPRAQPIKLAAEEHVIPITVETDKTKEETPKSNLAAKEEAISEGPSTSK